MKKIRAVSKSVTSAKTLKRRHQLENSTGEEQRPDMQDTGRRKKTDMEIAEEVITKYFRGGFVHQEGEK